MGSPESGEVRGQRSEVGSRRSEVRMSEDNPSNKQIGPANLAQEQRTRWCRVMRGRATEGAHRRTQRSRRSESAESGSAACSLRSLRPSVRYFRFVTQYPITYYSRRLVPEARGLQSGIHLCNLWLKTPEFGPRSAQNHTLTAELGSEDLSLRPPVPCFRISRRSRCRRGKAPGARSWRAGTDHPESSGEGGGIRPVPRAAGDPRFPSPVEP